MPASEPEPVRSGDTPEPLVSDEEFDEYERADPGPSEEEERYSQKKLRYYALIVARLGEPSSEMVGELRRLILRTARYMRLVGLRAPSAVLEREQVLIEHALDHLDPLWRTDGLSPEDAEAYRQASDRRSTALYDNLESDRASRADARTPSVGGDPRTPIERADDNPV